PSRFSHPADDPVYPRIGRHVAARVRKWLEENEPERYMAMPHGTALRMLYTTPRVYKSPTELVDPNDEGRVFDLLPLQSEYSAANLNSLPAYPSSLFTRLNSSPRLCHRSKFSRN